MFQVVTIYIYLNFLWTNHSSSLNVMFLSKAFHGGRPSMKKQQHVL